ncbi:MAG TPA: RICIN domain-containing protein [Kofleriaceae bacterium]|nr:RICIN domain-containing protein [Kofleriaceae bacterium]
MKIVSTRASVFGLCLAFGAFGAGCMTDGDFNQNEASVNSEISLDPTASYAMVGVQSNKCVGPIGGSTASGVQLEIENCTGTANQRWIPQPMSGGFFRWKNELNGLCIDVSGGSIFPGAAVIQFTCGTQANQQWAVTDVTGGSERITARHSGMVLDVTGQGTAAGTKIEQWFSNGGSNQHFATNEALPAIVR